jgi:hypothetical protein
MTQGESTIEWVLSKYLFKEDIEELLKQIGEPVDGSKEDVIARLLASEKFEEANALAYLDQVRLETLCDDLEIDSEGTREELFLRVLQQMDDEEDGVDGERGDATTAGSATVTFVPVDDASHSADGSGDEP